ncbi:ABC transporter ATP-binding protein [Orrella sp. 11846]|uniref:ABC transporter ATP-binding protein n=1 Tax=Orrella sp. 11846 TaxID=3409913 RepID=UPI003B5BCBBE
MSEQFAIRVKGLSKLVQDVEGDLRILDSINFDVNRGESVAIVGVSGSGKSTLLGLLAGLDVPSAGEVSLLGQNLFAMNEDQRAQFRAQHVGFVFQAFHLLPNLTALENVMLPLELMGRTNEKQAKALLESVGLGHRFHHYPTTLSGGEQQRVSLARAFMTQPDLLFADEPTGALDASTGARITELMFEMHRARGTTLILVTHDRDLASQCARRLEMQDGRLVEKPDPISVD